MAVGKINEILNKVYEYKNIDIDSGYAIAKQRIIRIRLSLATGLSMKKFTAESDDSEIEIKRILEALKGEEFGLENFPLVKA